MYPHTVEEVIVIYILYKSAREIKREWSFRSFRGRGTFSEPRQVRLGNHNLGKPQFLGAYFRERAICNSAGTFPTHGCDAA